MEACPTEAITETKLFEFSFTNRQDAIYTRDELLVDDEGKPQMLPWEDWSDAAAVLPHTSAWMRATAPSGSAQYEDRVSWAGELGFGVRPPEKGQLLEAPAAAEADDAGIAEGVAAQLDHDEVDAHGHPTGSAH